jgi:hypothetical protein
VSCTPIDIAAPPARVFDAIKRVRPDEILLFRTLIAIRGAAGPPPRVIQQAAATYESILDIATHSTFVVLADEAPREIVDGTVVGWPAGPRQSLTPSLFQTPLPPGYALAAMNFIVAPDGAGGSHVSTETRVFANSPAARRRFCRLLAGHLSRQRAHPPDVAARHSATRDQFQRAVRVCRRAGCRLSSVTRCGLSIETALRS